MITLSQNLLGLSILGLPSTALCMWGSSLANAALFALIFPAVGLPFASCDLILNAMQYIIMALHARPVPVDPYNPTVSLPPSMASSTLEDIRHPHPIMPIRLPIFALVLWLNDWVVRLLSLGGSNTINKQLLGIQKGANKGHRRMFSEAVDNMEEGDFAELSPIVGPSSQLNLPSSGSLARMRASGSLTSVGFSPRGKRD